jgi:nucleoside-diphosphate-sugar epimerase
LKVLVLGGAGYIGSLLVPKLLENHSVTVLDNFIYGQNSLPYSHNPFFDVHKVDVRDFDKVKPFLKDAEVIYPLAALVGAPLCDLNPIDAHLTNLEHPLKLFRVLSKDQRVIMPTTESAYGSNDKICTEDTPINALSSYAKDKAAVEAVLMQRENAVSLRLATVFGMSPRMRLDLLINDFVWRAAHDKTIVLFESHFKRTCVHIRDVVGALEHAIELSSGIYNIGAFSASKLDICKAIAKKTPFTYLEADSGSDPDQRNYIVSSKKASIAGVGFEWSLNLGIDELLKGYRMLNNNRYGNI